MPRSLAYSLAFLASTCFAPVALGQAPADAPSTDSQPVRISFSGDMSAEPATAEPTIKSWQSSSNKHLPTSEGRQKAPVILPASARLGCAENQGCTNWTDSCVHCGTAGCDGYGCGFGDYANEPTKFAPGGLWFKAEYVYWRISNNNVPALVTASPFGTDRADIGVLPDAQVLFGNEPIGDDFRSGYRFQSGIWLDDCEKWGIQGDFVMLGDDNTNFFVSSDGSPGLGRPFFNVDPNVNGEDARLIAYDAPNGDDELSGFVNVDATSKFQAAGISLRKRLSQGCGSRWDFMVGYRYLNLDETLSINDQSVADSDNNQILGTVVEIRDLFQTENQFHGVDLGIMGSWDMGKWALEGTVKCALGNSKQAVTIDGNTVVTIPGFTPFTDNQGLLAQSTNIGLYERNQFTIVPEARASASYFLTDHIRVTGGYTMIYVDNVLRPGDQIDRVVNGTLLQGPFSGPLRPEFNFNDTKMFIHGANISLDVMF